MVSVFSFQQIRTSMYESVCKRIYYSPHCSVGFQEFQEEVTKMLRLTEIFKEPNDLH